MMTLEEGKVRIAILWKEFHESKYPDTTWEKLLLESFKDNKHIIHNYDLLEELEAMKKS